ncbi:ABC transporter [Xylariales sp. PMI_506]|nr:ABC transporter [Xylariales sp. PMI_506]
MTISRASCIIAVEDVFGPTVDVSCVDGFDFTLLFEESILTILPLATAIIWGCFRHVTLYGQSTKVHASWQIVFKMLSYSVYIGLQVTLLTLWLLEDIGRTRLTTVCLGMTIGGYLFLSIVSYREHTYSVRPSTLLSVYLGASLILDLARVRTLFLIPDSLNLACIYFTSFVVKALLFVLESTEKQRNLNEKWKTSAPEETSGPINRALFIWTNQLFRQGFRTILTVDTLTDLDREILSASKPLKLKERWQKSHGDYALLWSFILHYKWNILAGVPPRLAYTAFSFLQPLLIQRVLDFTAEPTDITSNNVAYGLIGGYGMAYIGLAMSYAVYQHKTYRVLTLFRGSLVTLIFEKTLRISASSTKNAEAITLMSADIDRIETSMIVIHEFYAGLVEVALALWLLHRLLGAALIAPVLWIVLCLMVGIPLAAAAANAQVPWLEAIQERLTATSKTLGSLKPVKLSGLSKIASSGIASLRQAEIHASRRHRIMDTVIFVLSYASAALAPVWAFVVYVLISRANGAGPLTEGVAFSALSLIELLNQPLMFAMDGFEHVKTVINCFRRIQEYLEADEQTDCRTLADEKSLHASDTNDSGRQGSSDVSTKGKSIAWSGSTFSVVIMKHATASYSPDRDPVLRGINLEIPHGDITMIYGPVGSGKSTLLKLMLGEMPWMTGSVSTKFSRASYCPQVPWITWGSIRSNIIGMSPWDKSWYDSVVQACALHEDFKQLEAGDQHNVGTRGSRLSGGQQSRVSLARALYARNSVLILDDALSGLDQATEQHILMAVFGVGGLLHKMNCTAILATSSVHHLAHANNVILIDEKGRIAGRDALHRIGDTSSSHVAAAHTHTQPPRHDLPEEALEQLEILENPDLELRSNAADFKIYFYYAGLAGWGMVSVYLFACAIFVVGATLPSLWLQWWTNANATQPDDHIGYWLGGYAGLAAAMIVFNMGILPKTARKFHELLLDTTMRASTSFFTFTDVGTTINRFSRDLEIIDSDLPAAMDQTIFQFLSVIVSAVFVFMGSGYVAAAIPLCLLALYFIQFYYLRTSRQLRLLSIEATAPLFSHFLDTIDGLTSIRAYGWTEDYVELHYHALNASQKPYYFLFCIQRWLTLVLDLLNAAVAILLVAIATTIRNSSTGFLGVALFNVIAFSSTIQSLVTEWTQVETAMGAINRVRSYVNNVKDENLPRENCSVPEDWPIHGAVKFSKVTAAYDPSSEPVLKEITLVVAPGEKLAICGRTGSGKSSLVCALLRMVEIYSGSVTIDDVNLETISRQDIRSRLNTLPQESFFLAGSLRDNVDPWQTASDGRIIDVLRSVGLWEIFAPRGGLDADMDEDKLSHGQQRLVCLARCVIGHRRPGATRILVVDEATSGVDTETEALVQRILDREFAGCTVLAVAHRLHTVLDFDRVVVLDKGRIIEQGHPRALLSSPMSTFRALYYSLTPIFQSDDQEEDDDFF